MKVCSDCEVVQPFSKFSKNGKTPNNKTKYKPNCKVCENIMVRERYYRILKKYYGKMECSSCGYDKCQAALELHHRDPTKKEINPNKTKGRSEERILEEIRKCDILCANCHREFHAGLV